MGVMLKIWSGGHGAVGVPAIGIAWLWFITFLKPVDVAETGIVTGILPTKGIKCTVDWDCNDEREVCVVRDGAGCGPTDNTGSTDWATVGRVLTLNILGMLCVVITEELIVGAIEIVTEVVPIDTGLVILTAGKLSLSFVLLWLDFGL